MCGQAGGNSGTAPSALRFEVRCRWFGAGAGFAAGAAGAAGAVSLAGAGFAALCALARAARRRLLRSGAARCPSRIMQCRIRSGSASLAVPSRGR